MWNFIKNLLPASVLKNRWNKKSPPPSPLPVQTPPIERTSEVLLNDPTTPDLIISISNIPPSKPSYYVKNFKGIGFPLNTEEGQATNCNLVIANTLNYYNAISERPLNSWAAVKTLFVSPRAGKDLNAFYDRKSLQFFYATHPSFGTIYTANSTDIVAHELGHAILDACRPDMWSVMSIEVASFHEAFADIISILHILQYDLIIEKMLNEGLKNPNIVNKLAEQFGNAISKIDPDRNSSCLRCVINDFKYVKPGTLPESAPDNQLAAESHSFGRIMSGTLWDIFVLICSSYPSTIQGIKDARDLFARYLFKSSLNAPLNAKFFESFARTMLWADVTISNRRFHDDMWKIFANRNMIAPQVLLLLSPESPKERISFYGNNLNAKLSNYLIQPQSSSNNVLYDVEIEIPLQGSYYYDNDGNLYDIMFTSENEAISAAQDMINYLHVTNSVSNDSSTPFEIIDGKLTRTHFKGE